MVSGEWAARIRTGLRAFGPPRPQSGDSPSVALRALPNRPGVPTTPPPSSNRPAAFDGYGCTGGAGCYSSNVAMMTLISVLTLRASRWAAAALVSVVRLMRPT